MEIEMREIITNDYSEVILLWNEVIGNSKVNNVNFHITIDEMKEAGNYKTFVALSGTRVVGFVSVMQALAAGFLNGYLHIQGIAVQKELQHKGIGSKLLGYVENYAKETGISTIILCCGVKRLDSHAFYEHNGYSKDSYCFDKSVG